VATRQCVDYYNDSKAPTSMLLQGHRGIPGSIHLILGGKDENSNYADLSDLLSQPGQDVYTIGSAAAKIESPAARRRSALLLRNPGTRSFAAALGSPWRM